MALLKNSAIFFRRLIYAEQIVGEFFPDLFLLTTGFRQRGIQRGFTVEIGDIDLGAMIHKESGNLHPAPFPWPVNGSLTLTVSHGIMPGNTSGITGGLSLGEMLSVVVYGRNNMPAFGNALESKQLKDLGSYITEVLLPD